ncbi:MAG: NUDIX hydrolase [Chloroflexota bacterium]|nr:NUDIX hydrolase [Chloroflexota bacterium]
MKAQYTDVWFNQGREIPGSAKSVKLPFRRVSARAVILRRKDGFIIGTLHRKDGKYALPGGAVEDGESTEQAVRRELAEENINLLNPEWDSRVVVDHFDGYGELSVWHIVIVDQAEIGYSEENVESRWVSQEEDVWYPSMREHILLGLNRYHPELCHAKIEVHTV